MTRLAEGESVSQSVVLVTGRFGRRVPMRVLLTLAACVTLLLVPALWFLSPPMGEPELSEVSGYVRMERMGQPHAFARGTRLQPGDSLFTGTNAAAVLGFGKEPTRFDLGGEAEFKVVSLISGKRFDLRAGKLEASVSRQRPFHPLIVTTPNAEATVVGTRFTLTAAMNRTQLDVDGGKVRLADLSNASAKPVKVSVRHYAIVAPATELAALPKTGGLLRECWTNIPGSMVLHLTSHPDFPAQPDGQDVLAVFSTDVMRTNNFGARLRGFVHPPVTGDYTFWMDARDDALLLLSADENPRNQVQIAYSRETDASSSPIPLVAGRRYSIEVLHKIGDGQGHLAVEWQGPGRPREIVQGDFLSPERPRKKYGAKR